MDSLVRVWYFGLTTLCTIGFGDYAPKSVEEKILISLILNFGVACFSFIMGNFIQILMARNKMEDVGENRDLSKWIALLTKYNQSNPLPKKLIQKIEDFFDYYWKNNPLLAFKNEEDMRFMKELPESTI